MKKLSLLMVTFLIFQPLTIMAANQNNNVVQEKVAEAQKEISDSAITAKVKSKLLTDSRTQGTKIHVKTHFGVVSLSGRVENEAEKQAAEAIAGSTDNVKSVINQLEIK